MALGIDHELATTILTLPCGFTGGNTAVFNGMHALTCGTLHRRISSFKHADSIAPLALHDYPQFDAILPLWTEQWDAAMEYQTVTGKYRWNRRHSSYKNSRLPTSADKLFFIMVFIKQAPTQEMHGTVFGMAQPTAHTWIHVLEAV